MLQSKIYEVRGQKVMLDYELAETYGDTTKKFNQQVKNNIKRFVEDFRFQLSKEELADLGSKFLTSSWAVQDISICVCRTRCLYAYDGVKG